MELELLLFSFFWSYLCCRKQYVLLKETKSELLTITCGVPQGSILGPILFLIFINDLNTVSSKLETIRFADDTNLFSTGNSIDAVEQQLNTELVLINTWFQANLLSLNVTETSFITFFLNNILGLHTALVPQDGLLFNLTRSLIMVQNNNVHFILTKTYRSMSTMNKKEIIFGRKKISLQTSTLTMFPFRGNMIPNS